VTRKHFRLDSNNYYDENSSEFISRTVNQPLDHLYQPFLEHIPIGGIILDAGCGSGRDSKVFVERGYTVVAVDTSKQMVASTNHLAGNCAKLQDFRNLDYCDKFDGIWACASLVHLDEREILDTLLVFSKSLKCNGVCYISLKSNIIPKSDGRRFNNITLSQFQDISNQQTALQLIRLWPTETTDLDSFTQQWTNALLFKY
jgi:SAM-dependent methyltransferase